MAKVQRLYRLENIYGTGLYQSDPRLGVRLAIDETYDIDLYRKGERREIEYRTISGERHIHRTDCGVERIVYPDLESVRNEIKAEPTQLKLYLGTTTNPVKLLKNMIGGFDVDFTGETMLFGSREWRQEHKRQRIPEQLQLDVNREPVLLKTKLTPNGNKSLAYILEKNIFHSDEYSFCDADECRPAPRDDGIEYTQEHFFAFRSLEKLSDWLEGATPKDCLANGAVIKVLDVKEAIHGDCQSVYRKRDVVKEFAIVAGDLWRVRNQIPSTVIENA